MLAWKFEFSPFFVPSLQVVPQHAAQYSCWCQPKMMKYDPTPLILEFCSSLFSLHVEMNLSSFQSWIIEAERYLTCRYRHGLERWRNRRNSCGSLCSCSLYRYHGCVWFYDSYRNLDIETVTHVTDYGRLVVVVATVTLIYETRCTVLLCSALVAWTG